MVDFHQLTGPLWPLLPIATYRYNITSSPSQSRITFPGKLLSVFQHDRRIYCIWSSQTFLIRLLTSKNFMIFWTQSTNSLNFALTFASQETTKSHDNYIISRKLAGQASNVHSVELTGFMLWGKWYWSMLRLSTGLMNFSVDQHIPKNEAQNVNEHPWINHKLLKLIKVKNKVRTAAKKWQHQWSKQVQTNKTWG